MYQRPSTLCISGAQKLHALSGTERSSQMTMDSDVLRPSMVGAAVMRTSVHVVEVR